MKFKSVILPLASQDIKEAAGWYNNQLQGLGKRFTAHIRKTIQYIQNNPYAIAVRYDNVRTALLGVFPYMIHFTLEEERKRITILAVLHTSREPKIWTDRRE